INGLDLLSFLLVTPELIRFARVAVGRLTYSFVFIAISAVIAGAMALVVTTTSSMPTWVRFLAFILLLPFLSSLLDVFKEWWQQQGPTASNAVAAHSFFIGVAVFFTSRIIAFAIAAHQLLNAPE